MRILFFLFVVCLFSCKDSERKEVDIRPPIPKDPFKDSLVLAEQSKAIGDIKFGISEKQFKKEKDSFDKKTEIPAWEGSTVMDHKIGEYEYSYLSGYFHNDSLYKIILTGHVIEYDDYDREMSTEYYSLFDMMKSKYGVPKVDRGLPRWTDIDKGYFQRTAEWEIGSRKIELRITCTGTYYNLDLVSFKPSVEEMLQSLENKKKIESSEKGVKVL